MIPLAICVLIFVFIFRKIPPAKAWEALQTSNIPLFIFVAVVYFFWVHVFDCLAIKHFISRFSAPISHKESWLVRGVTYIMMIINYHAAQGVFAYYFKKTHKAPLSKTLGTMAFISIGDLILILTSALIALGFTNVTYQGFDFRLFVLRLAPIIYLGYGLFILFWKNADRPVIRKLARFRLVGWLLRHNLFLIFREAKLGDYLLLFVLRIPLIIAVIGGYNLALGTFGFAIPWSKIFLYNPIIMLIATLPITPAGLGTGQFFTIQFFQNHVSHSNLLIDPVSAASLLLASSLIWFLANQIIKVIFGVVCLIWTNSAQFKISDRAQ